MHSVSHRSCLAYMFRKLSCTNLTKSDLNGAQFPRLKSVTCVLYGLTLTYLNRYRLIEIQMNALSPL